MTADNSAEVELDQIRRILLGPIEEVYEARDKRIFDFIKAETTATNERLERMEARLNEISAGVEGSRRNTLRELSKAISELAQQPKRLVVDAAKEDIHDNVQALAASRNVR